jgi:Cu+-exporting ATPase
MKKELVESTCYHCGSACNSTHVVYANFDFCCEGCKLVHQILQENGLEKYYDISEKPGVSFLGHQLQDYQFLDDEKVQLRLLSFKSDKEARLSFQIPAIHCSSCIWLLENLNKLHPGIKQVRVHFLEKKAAINFDPSIIGLRQLAELLSSIGYEPYISSAISEAQPQKADHKLLKQIAVAGFCFGNSMLFSFPEYFGLQSLEDAIFKSTFGFLNFGLGLSSLLYSGRDYLTQAWNSLRNNFVHISVPLAIGILALFLRSTYEVLVTGAAGYFDSLTGLIFFLLVGKWFQEKTYGHISFNRDYKSYFPLAVSCIKDDQSIVKLLEDVEIGDRLLVKNGELIPADGILLRGSGNIDYSFVSGESVPVFVELGEIVYAGGRQIGSPIELEVCKEVEQSRLTQLWNEYGIQHRKSGMQSFTNTISKYFTIGLLSIALLSFLYWSLTDVSKAFFVFTSILIVACPCALALSSPFALNNAMGQLGKLGFYLKNADVVERMANLTKVVFDKTGTLTDQNQFDITYRGEELTNYDKQLIRSVLAQSSHPFSRALYKELEGIAVLPTLDFEEIPGKGLLAYADGKMVRIGSLKFLGREVSADASLVAIEIGEVYRGAYQLGNNYRAQSKAVISGMAGLGLKMSVLSGDNSNEQARLKGNFPELENLYFQKDPAQKLEIIKQEKTNGQYVMMLGDGLNDAGALAQSDVGVVLTDNVNNFTPAADGIIQTNSFNLLPRMIKYARQTLLTVRVSFGLSILYNVVGLSFAVQGLLSPIVAAILMPISSISVVLFNTISTSYLAKNISKP